METENEDMNNVAERIYDAELTVDDLEASLEAELAHDLSELSFLEEERDKIENPDSLGKVILEEVWNQFGNQIGLDMTNETLIQEYNRKHPEEYNKAIADAIMQDDKYKQANKSMKQQQEDGTLTDSYTGKKLGANDKPNLDHVVPRKELYDNPRRKQANIDTKDLANKSENLAPTNESLNKSKQDKSNQQYVSERETREEYLKKRAETQRKKIDESNKSEPEKRIEREKVDKRLQDKLDANDELMLDVDAKARKAINKDIAYGAAKQTAKKAGKDALKMMAVTALFDLLKAIMNGLVRFFKEKQKTFERFLSEMKAAIKQFVSHISSFVQTGVSSVVGTIVSEIFGPIVSMFKKLSSFIKQGASTLVEAVHYLTSKENKDKPLSIKIAQVGKIVTAGLTAAGAIILGELFEKALLQLPVMAVEIPLLGSLANITGMFMASLLSGVVGAIVINKLEGFIAKKESEENLHQQIKKKGEILKTQSELIGVSAKKLLKTKENVFDGIADTHKKAAKEIGEALSNIFDEENDDLDAENEELERMLQAYI